MHIVQRGNHFTYISRSIGVSTNRKHSVYLAGPVYLADKVYPTVEVYAPGRCTSQGELPSTETRAHAYLVERGSTISNQAE